MKQMKKTMVVATGVLSLASLTSVAADETDVVRASTSGSGSSKSQDMVVDENTTDPVFNREVKTLDNSLKAIARKHGVSVEKLDEEGNESRDFIQNGDKAILEKAKGNAIRLEGLLAEYQLLKGQVASQIESLASTTGAASNVRTKDLGSVSINVLDSSSFSALETMISEMKKTLEDNKRTVTNSAGNSDQLNKALSDGVAEANRELAKASADSAHSVDGVVGNYDDIRRKAEDSAKTDVIKTAEGTKSGVLVDVSETNKGSSSQISTEIKEIEVKSVTELESKKAEALAMIEAGRKSGETSNMKAGDYRDNALANIDTINAWLQKEQDRADNIQTEIDKSLTVAEDFEAYKKRVVASMEDVKTWAQSLSDNEAKEFVLAQVNTNMDKVLKESKVEVKPTSNVDTAKDLDLGDIGVSTADMKAKLDAATKTIDGAVASALEKMKSSQAKAVSDMKASEGGLNTDLDGYKGKVEEYIQKLKANQARNKQIDADNEAVRRANKAQFDSRKLIFTGDYAKDKATADAWNAEYVGKTGSETGVLATKNTSYEVISGGQRMSADEVALTSWAHGGDKDFDNKNGFVWPHGQSIKIRVKNTTKGDLILTFSNVRGVELSNTKNFVYLWEEAGGGIAFGLSMSNGEMREGAGGCAEGMCFGGGVGLVHDFIKSYDVLIESEAKDISRFTFNDNDNQQSVFFKRGADGTFEKGVNVQQNGNTFTSIEGNVSQGSIGELGSNSIGIDYANPRQVAIGLTHTNGRNNLVNIIGGVFGQSSASKYTPIQLSPYKASIPFDEELPTMSVKPVNVVVESFEMSDPNARAYTNQSIVGNPVNVRLVINPLKAPSGSLTDLLSKVEVSGVRSAVQPTIPEEKIGSSSNSFVVRGKNSNVKVSSGNSLTVRSKAESKKASSGNTLVVRQKESKATAASGNTLVVRKGSQAEVIKNLSEASSKQSGSVLNGISSILGQAKENGQESANNGSNSQETSTVKPSISVDVKEETNTSKETVTGQALTLSVYVESAIKEVAKEAMESWARALSNKGLALQVQLTDKVEDLEKGVTMAFLDSDDTTTRLTDAKASLGVEDDEAFEMKGLTGLAMTTSDLDLVASDSNDKYNKSGSIKDASVLKNSRYVIQLNTEAVNQASLKHVLTHEIGHLFGLKHDDYDSLMASSYDNPVFTGEISNLDATMAAAYLMTRMK